MKQPPNPLSALVNIQDGRGVQTFIDFLSSLDVDPVATLSTLPKPIVGRRVFVSDATGGGVPCYADGTAWRRYSNDAIVS